MSSASARDRERQLSEAYIQDSFHSYLKSSLTQAKSEKLLDAQILSSAEGDLMITGPALCLYFAALRSTTNPPSVPLPRHNKTAQPMELSPENCPPAFVPFLRVWVATVPHIQGLIPEHQHDLARIICNLAPLTNPTPSVLSRIAADLRAVAIEISQRRSFQERYGGDLQAAIDSGEGVKMKTSFVPPPMYDASPVSTPSSSPRRPEFPLPGNHAPPAPHHPPPSPALLSPWGGSAPLPTSPTHSRTHSRSASASSASSGWSRSPSPAPSILNTSSPAIEFIRETLYASLADVISSNPSIRLLLKADPPRAYFAAVAFAILDVSTHNITPEGSVIGVLGQPLTLADCPPELRPFMAELANIGQAAKEVEEQDDGAAIQAVQSGGEAGMSRMERVKMILQKGIGADMNLAGLESGGMRAQEARGVIPGDDIGNQRRSDDRGRRSFEASRSVETARRSMDAPRRSVEEPRRSVEGPRRSGEQPRSNGNMPMPETRPLNIQHRAPREPNPSDGRRSAEGRAVAFANRINGLSLRMTQLPAFRERQEEVFKVLAGIDE